MSAFEARIRWILTAITLLALVLQILATQLSIVWVDGRGQPRVLLTGGNVRLDVGPRSSEMRSPLAPPPGWHVARTPTVPHVIAGIWWEVGSSAYAFSLPMWPVLAASGFLAGCFWFSMLRHRAANAPGESGGDLLGTATGPPATHAAARLVNKRTHLPGC